MTAMSTPGGMSPDEFRARMLRIMAGRARVTAAQLDLAASIVDLSTSMRSFNEAFAAREARDVAEHPDLAQLDVQLDGYYGG